MLLLRSALDCLRFPVYYAKCLPLPGKSEMLGKRKPQVPFGLVQPLDKAGKNREKKRRSNFEMIRGAYVEDGVPNCN